MAHARHCTAYMGRGRPTESPTPADVLDAMEPDRCYVVADLAEEFDDKNRGTIRVRLEALANAGRIRRRKHANRTVTYRKPEE